MLIRLSHKENPCLGFESSCQFTLCTTSVHRRSSKLPWCAHLRWVTNLPAQSKK